MTQLPAPAGDQGPLWPSEPAFAALPPSRRLADEERRAQDLALGISPLARTGRPQTRLRQLLAPLVAAGLAAGCLWLYFPWERFFRPSLRPLAGTTLVPLGDRSGLERKVEKGTASPEERLLLQVEGLIADGRLQEALTTLRREAFPAGRPLADMPLLFRRGCELYRQLGRWRDLRAFSDAWLDRHPDSLVALRAGTLARLGLLPDPPPEDYGSCKDLNPADERHPRHIAEKALALCQAWLARLPSLPVDQAPEAAEQIEMRFLAERARAEIWRAGGRRYEHDDAQPDLRRCWETAIRNLEEPPLKGVQEAQALRLRLLLELRDRAWRWTSWGSVRIFDRSAGRNDLSSLAAFAEWRKGAP